MSPLSGSGQPKSRLCLVRGCLGLSRGEPDIIRCCATITTVLRNAPKEAIVEHGVYRVAPWVLHRD